jgi:hypothetical protein
MSENRSVEVGHCLIIHRHENIEIHWDNVQKISQPFANGVYKKVKIKVSKNKILNKKSNQKIEIKPTVWTVVGVPARGEVHARLANAGR